MYARASVNTSHNATNAYVNFPKKSDGPNAPNIELDEPPPNAEPKSEPFPCCSNTNAIIAIARTIHIILIKTILFF